MASNYQRGRAKEYACMDLLKQAGYSCTRSASSHGLWDVAAVRADEVRLIQTKLTSSGDFSEDENCRLFRELPVHPTTKKELWLYERGQGIVEIRDLKEEKPDSRTAAGKLRREVARKRAASIRYLSSSTK